MILKRTRIILLTVGITTLLSCSKPETVKDPITIQSPVPTEQITKVTLDETQKGYVEAGNMMAFRFLGEMFKNENLVCSPLSLQYAMAMTANGASGQTRQEIIDFLGYGEDGIDALNEYSKILLEQLPAVDLDVTLKVTDALLVNDLFPLLPSFKETVENHYYAAVENMDFSDPAKVAARINEWASRNTEGFIDNILSESEISEKGTEAGAVTIVEMPGESEGPDDEPKRIYFTADHPFVFVIGEKTSGTILFEGVCTKP